MKYSTVGSGLGAPSANARAAASHGTKPGVVFFLKN